MDGDAVFAMIRRSFEEFIGEFRQASADQATSETLIATAEYELEQVKRLFAAHRLHH
ncbi:MAG: hypothetical protein WC807_03860 [Hyphomicrobium sp.]|jgi:hypothetical protein